MVVETDPMDGFELTARCLLLAASAQKLLRSYSLAKYDVDDLVNL